jgi:hypothetical protein
VNNDLSTSVPHTASTPSRSLSPSDESPKKKKKKAGAVKVKKPSLDLYAMSCRACGMDKQTISGLKMHIKAGLRIRI